MTGEFKVAVAQISPVTFDMNACVSKICDYVDIAADKNAQIIVFGETCAGGYPGWRPPVVEYANESFFKSEADWISKKLFTSSESIPGPATDKLCRKAKERNVHIVTGFTEGDHRIKGTIYNSSVVIGPNGQIIGRHRKLHLGSLELAYWKKGDIRDLQVIKTSLASIGLAICYDALFPEYTRLLDIMGEEMQCQLWATSKGYETASNHCPIIRALEGGVFVVSACLVGRDDQTGFEYAGDSQVVDPFGRVLSRAKTGAEEVIYADVELDRILDYRAGGSFTLGMDRREDLYDLSLLEHVRKSTDGSVSRV